MDEKDIPVKKNKSAVRKTAVKKKTVPKIPKKETIEKKEESKTPAKNINHILVLIIMILLTVLVVFSMKYYKMSSGIVPDIKKTVNQNIDKAEKKSVQKDNTENKKISTETDKDNSVETVLDEKVKLYFVKLNTSNNSVDYVSVNRSVKSGNNNLFEMTLLSLINGPSVSEKKAGLSTAVPNNIVLKSLEFKNSLLFINFDNNFSSNAIGDILTARINQIYLTAIQFNSVKGIIIKINGKTINTVEGDGRVLTWPMTHKL